jgi:hypothetical protein
MVFKSCAKHTQMNHHFTRAREETAPSEHPSAPLQDEQSVEEGEITYAYQIMQPPTEYAPSSNATSIEEAFAQMLSRCETDYVMEYPETITMEQPCVFVHVLESTGSKRYSIGMSCTYTENRTCGSCVRARMDNASGQAQPARGICVRDAANALCVLLGNKLYAKASAPPRCVNSTCLCTGSPL